jgi:hypothetical protein
MLPLFWQATGEAISLTPARLQLRDRQGNVVAEQNVKLTQPARGGDIIESRPTLALPVRLADGRYDFFVVGSNAVRLASLKVKGRERLYRVPPIAHRRPVQLGGSVELLGYEVNDPVKPGDKINLKLIWRTSEVMSRGYKVFVHVVDANGKLLVQKDGVPGNWSLPTDTWAAGEIIVDPYVIPIPPEAVPGDYVVQVGMYDPDNGQRLAAVEKGARLADDSIPLVTVTIR